MIIINLQVNILQELLVPSKQLIEHVERDGLVPRQLDGLEEVVDDHLQVLAPGLRAQHRPVVYFFIIYYYFLLLLLLLLLFFFLMLRRIVKVVDDHVQVLALGLRAQHRPVQKRI